MGNCLVTKFKGTVDNPDLRVFGEMRLKVHNTNADSMYLKLWFKDVATAQAFTVNNENVQLLPIAGTSEFRIIKLGVGTYDLKLISKYDLKGIYSVVDETGMTPLEPSLSNYMLLPAEEAAYSSLSAINSIIVGGDLTKIPSLMDMFITYPTPSFPSTTEYLPSGDLADIIKEGMATMYLQDGSDFITGDIANLARAAATLQGALKLSASNNGSAIYGDLASLAPCIHITSFLTLARTQVQGTAESLLKGMWNNGKRDGFSLYIDNQFSINGKIPGKTAGSAVLGWLACNFDSTGVVVTKISDSSHVATYTAATDSWTYA